MTMTINFSNALGVHEQALMLRDQRSTILASNIANTDTPGFKARDFDFASVLRDRMGMGSEEGLAGSGSTPRLALQTSSGRHISNMVSTFSDDELLYLLNELISRLEQENRGSVRFNSSAIASMSRHPWPGNVRELANLVERMAILHPHGIVGVNDLPPKFRHLAEDEIVSMETLPVLHAPASTDPRLGSRQALLPLNGLDLKEYLANLEKDLIEQALNDSGGIVARAADRLNIRRTTLVEKMRKYDMQRKVDEDG